MLPDVNDRDAWLKWRNKGIGSSDVPAILGLCPYRSAFEVFEEKTGRRKREEKTNFAIDRGNQLEPVARSKFAAWYNLNLQPEVDETFEPKLYQMKEMPFMRTSLDGQSHDGETNIEIKYLGVSDYHQLEWNGVIKTAHYAQMQHQMLVSGAKQTYYVGINFDQQICSNLVHAKESFLALSSMIPRCLDFWECVKANRWPTESDDEHLAADLRLWKTKSDEIKLLETERRELADRIFQTNVEHCRGFTVKTIERKGSINYQNIKELENVDLEAYRKEATSYKVITYNGHE